ncbi:D-allose transport system permease protein AlsC [Propionicimonas sp. T2.31MG-18]|uniref:ABC transporter permease n=1 Tax=Propionicimonas sp. T2.31MG-18 TaxID=3157620 RepID=UPI0035EF3BC4
MTTQLSTDSGPQAGARTRTVRLPGGRTEPLKLFSARIALPVILLFFVIVFSALRPDTFATASNLTTVLSLQAVLTILCLGLLLPLIVGELDLSIAGNLGLSVILVTGLTSQSGWPLVPALVAAVGVSTLIGLVNGLLVTRIGINSFIVTIAMSALITGFIGGYTQGNVFYSNIPEGLVALGRGDFLGVPKPVVYAALVALLLWYLLSSTPLGRYFYAIGGSKDASRLSGVSVKNVTLLAFAGAGFLAGVAGIVQAGILGSGNPTVGSPFLLPAYAAAFLGATAVQPGVFNVWGTVLAVITVQVGTTGLVLLGAPFWIEPVFQGGALLIAVIAARWLKGEEI